jgi:hypothetical protein
MRSNNVSRRDVIAGTLALAVLSNPTTVVADEAAKQATLPPGNGDGQLVAAQAILRGYGGQRPMDATFYELLGVKKREQEKLAPPIASGADAELCLFNVHAGVGSDAKDPIKQFETAFLQASRWLLDRPDGAFDRWREQGRRADVLVVLHMKSTQRGRIDGAPNLLVMPPKFLLACSSAGLPVVLSLYC